MPDPSAAEEVRLPQGLKLDPPPEIRQARRADRRQVQIIRMPVHAVEKLNKINRASAVVSELGRAHARREIPDVVKLLLPEIESIKRSAQTHLASRSWLATDES
ncbi:MAG: hypothetical protein H6531_07670 [Actinobacteria bacterium]|nr:hypothetical protein [Actinomycetota bacterium]